MRHVQQRAAKKLIKQGKWERTEEQSRFQTGLPRGRALRLSVQQQSGHRHFLQERDTKEVAGILAGGMQVPANAPSLSSSETEISRL